MRELTANTTFTFSKRDLITDGIYELFHPALNNLKNKLAKDLVNLIIADLRDVDNNFQFILTVKKLENNEI